MERRFVEQLAAAIAIESRADRPPVITGYAARYYDGTAATEFRLWDGAVERIMPGAFDAALADGHDARALFNHNPDHLLGRVSAGTLKLAADDLGLRYEIHPGDTSIARDVLEHIRRGDLQGSSFAFEVVDQDWRTEDKTDIREIRAVRLFDVGPVTYPAYESTSTAIRSADSVEARKAFDVLQANRLRRKLRALRLRSLQVEAG